MIFELYAAFLIISGVLIYFGKSHDSPILQLTGYTFAFLLGVTLMLGGVNYKSGQTITVIDAALYNGSVIGVNTFTNYTYSAYSGEVVTGIQIHHFFGLFFALASAFGFIVTLFNLKSGLEPL